MKFILLNFSSTPFETKKNCLICSTSFVVSQKIVSVCALAHRRGANGPITGGRAARGGWRSTPTTTTKTTTIKKTTTTTWIMGLQAAVPAALFAVVFIFISWTPQFIHAGRKYKQTIFFFSSIIYLSRERLCELIYIHIFSRRILGTNVLNLFRNF